MAGKKHKALITVTAVFAAIVIAVTQNVFAFDVNENSKQMSELEKQNSEYQQQLKETESSIQKKREESKKLQEKIVNLSIKIQESSKKISELNSEIKEKQAEIDKKLNAIQDRLNKLRTRLRAIQLAGDTSSLEIILGAKDFSDFLDKAELVKSLSSYDDKLIKGLQSEMNTISQEQQNLKKDKADAEKEKASLEKNKDEINKLSQKNSKILEELSKTQENIKSAIDTNQKQQDALNAALEKYNKEMAEKARKAQEAARKAREQAEQNNSGGDNIVVKSDGSFVWPCPGHTNLTSTFDEWRGVNNHGALDIADGSVYGSQVVACYNGTVFSTNTGCPHDYGKDSSCGCGGGYGNYVMIDHGNGKISIYGHLSGVTVNPGDKVVAGQLIGYVGSTGYSTGPHLHFEMRYDGVRYDPLSEYGN